MRMNNRRTGLGWGLLGMIVVALAISLAGEDRRPLVNPGPPEHTGTKGKIVKTDGEWKKILTREQYRILRKSGTERAFTGRYDDHDEKGLYACAGCGETLFTSTDKYDSGCGWPAFQKPADNTNVEEKRDTRLGMLRREVLCARCGGHLGHVFSDGPQPTGLRYCINSAALEFQERKNNMNEESTMRTAIFGTGCFWCTEALLERIDGVESVKVGYMGGRTKNPTYKQVCEGDTGHAEVAQLTYDSRKLSYEELLNVFWKIHDPTTLNRQGGDVGTQYRSVIFYGSEAERAAAELSKTTQDKTLKKPIVTQIVPATEFYEAENYHQDYYANNPNAAYCRAVIAPKVEKFSKQ